MRLVGLTGGIGSGKSQVSAILSRVGAPVIDADRLARQVERRGEPAWRQIIRLFGWSVLAWDGELDRRRLGRIIFTDSAWRDRLNAVVHPAVHRLMRSLVDAYQAQGERVVVLDVPLLIEVGLDRWVDEVWVVYATPEQQIERVCRRDHIGADEARLRVAAQMALTDKLKRADRVIDNSGRPEDLEAQVLDLWNDVRARA